MNTAFQIAVMRAKMIARRDFRRAVELMLGVGVALNNATRFILSVLRMQRGA